MKKNDVRKLYDDAASLGWDYQRMSRSGMECFDDIMVNLGVLEQGEHWNEDVFECKGGYH